MIPQFKIYNFIHCTNLTIAFLLFFSTSGTLEYEYGQGIWCGIVFSINGLLGVSTALSPSILKMKLFVFSTMSSIIFAIILAFLSILNIDALRYSLAHISLEGHPYSTFSTENAKIRTHIMLLVVLIVISIVVVFLMLFSMIGIILISLIRSRIDFNERKKGVIWV